MRKRRTRAALIAIAAAVVLSAAACEKPWDWHWEPIYTNDTSMPYYAPEGYGTAPAVIKMWAQYYANASYSQADIWASLASHGAQNGDGGTSPYLFADATQYFSGTNTYLAVYDGGAGCNGGRNCAAQAVADIHKAIQRGAPPAILTQWNKYGIVKTFGASKYCNPYGYCQPEVDWVHIHIPANGYGENHYETTSQLLFDLGSLVTVFYSEPWDYLGVTNDDWAAYDADAATYYGDPNPPAPVWYGGGGGGDDGGGCHNANGDPCEASAVTPGGTDTTAATGKTKRGFVPDPKTRPDIIADFVAGIKRTHLNSQPGLESLTLEDGKLQVSAIVKVRSVSEHPDYFILYLEDRATHRLYAQGTVHASGLLGAVRLLSDSDQPLAVTGPENARAHALQEFGITAQGDAEPIFAYGDIGLPQFTPVFLLTDTDGRSIVVTPEGRAFQMTGLGKNLVLKAGETSLRGKQGEQLILRELARSR